MKLQFANLSLDESNVPVAENFGDVYYSRDDGLAESNYVFVQGNRLLQRWEEHTGAHFSIAETGFGTGLNAAITIDHFLQFRKAYPEHRLKHLHFTSFELHPICVDELRKIAANWPQFEQTYNALVDAYPPNLSGTYRITMYDGVVTLDLVLGDIKDTIAIMHKPATGIDAWFLDGFAPSKNEAMWHESVFAHIQRLSHPGSSIATFTSAGFVRRGLEAVQFNVTKIRGFGRKREMITGVLANECPSTSNHYFRRSGAAVTKHCSVVGGGIAGLLTSLALLKRGVNVELICKNDIGDGASGNHVAGFYPQLQADYSLSTEFYCASFYYAHQLYSHLHKTHPFDHQFNGALLLGFNEKQVARFTKMAQRELWPESLATFVDHNAATNIAGVPVPHGGMLLGNAGWLSPISLVNAVLKACQRFSGFTLTKHTELTRFEDKADHVLLSLNTLNSTNSNTETQARTDALVIATGSDSGALLDGFDLRLTRGQVEFLPTDETMHGLDTLICHKGYFTPSYKGFHAVGSTYIKNDCATDVRDTETQLNIDTHKQAMTHKQWQQFLDDARLADNAFSRASVRCSTADHLPLVGNIPDIRKQQLDYASLKTGKASARLPTNRENCFVITGLGSRGFTTGPLCAELIAAQITDQPLPLSMPLLDALNPNRYIIRALKRAVSTTN